MLTRLKVLEGDEAWETYRSGSPIKLTIRSPVAVSYLAQAPGALGMARAYVSGHLDLEGDMFTALSRMCPGYSCIAIPWK